MADVYMPYTTLLTDLTEGVFTITLNRPDVLNAFNDAMAEELQDALKKAERDAAEVAREVACSRGGPIHTTGVRAPAPLAFPATLLIRQAASGTCQWTAPTPPAPVRAGAAIEALFGGQRGAR